MNSALRISLILILVGVLIFVIALAAVGFDFKNLDGKKYQTNTYEINEDFNAVCVNVNTTDVTFALSEDGVCRVVCYEEQKFPHTASVQNGTLNVAAAERQWYNDILNFKHASVTVYLPKSEYTSLAINTDTGDVQIPDNLIFESIDISGSTGDVKCYASVSASVRIYVSTANVFFERASAGAVDISVSTGDIVLSGVSSEGDVKLRYSTGYVYMTDVYCKNLVSDGSTGDMTMKNVIASGNFSLTSSTGNVTFERCDAAEIFVNVSTGDVTGSLLSEKIFMAKASTGDINVPETTSGGRCKIETSTGDIHIVIAG
jgi:DUF4097 and DUF4098 domain-containing protein YvlB